MPTPFQEYAEITQYLEDHPEFPKRFWKWTCISHYQTLNNKTRCICFTKGIHYDKILIGHKLYWPHRVAFILSKYFLPDASRVRRLCGTADCINPLHLKAYESQTALLNDYNRSRKQLLRHKRDEMARWVLHLRSHSPSYHLLSELQGEDYPQYNDGQPQRKEPPCTPPRAKLSPTTLITPKEPPQ